MTRIQTRKAINIKGLTYYRAKKYCEERGMTFSGWIEELVAKRLDELQTPSETTETTVQE